MLHRKKAFGCTNALSNESDRMLPNVDLSNEPVKWREMVAFMPFNSSTSHSSSKSRVSATSQLAVVQKRVETGPRVSGLGFHKEKIFSSSPFGLDL